MEGGKINVCLIGGERTKTRRVSNPCCFAAFFEGRARERKQNDDDEVFVLEPPASNLHLFYLCALVFSFPDPPGDLLLTPL